jgi:hypothetical protein
MSDYEQKIPTINFEKIENELNPQKMADFRTEAEPDPQKPAGRNGKEIMHTYDMNKEVVVVDIQMPFALMVGCMLKWALAAILAVIIICATFIFGVLVAAGFIYGLTGENILGNILNVATIF